MLESLEKKQRIVVERYSRNAAAVHSQISYGGRDVCRCFENADFLIPPGKYVAYMYKSAKFKRWCLQLVVSGRVGICMHPANYAAQLKGSFAPITTTTYTGGTQSTQALDKLLAGLTKGQSVLVEIIDNYQPTGEPLIGLS